jgi:hypothetical protein
MSTPTNSGRAKRRCTKDVKYSDLSSSPNADFGLITTKDPDKFRKLLESKKFEDLRVRVVPGSLLTQHWARKDGLREPIMIHDRRGLGLTVPPVEFTVRDVANIIGDKLQISAIEVSSQAELPKWNLSDWASYYEGHKAGMPILNVISLEFSQTRLREQVTSPKVRTAFVASAPATDCVAASVHVKLTQQVLCTVLPSCSLCGTLTGSTECGQRAGGDLESTLKCSTTA